MFFLISKSDILCNKHYLKGIVTVLFKY